MNKRFFNQQNLTRRLRLLSVLFAMLLMPLSAWAEDYDLWIGDIQVTDANKGNVLGDGETATVVFTPANNTVSPATPATLTLNGAELTDPIKVGLTNLTIHLIGTNTIALNGNGAVLNSTNSNAALTITKEDASASLTISNKYASGQQYPVIFNFASVSYPELNLISPFPTTYEYVVNGTIEGKGLNYLYKNHALPPSPVTFSSVTTYPLWVAGTQVTENNKNNITGKATPEVTFTPASGENAARLSLSSATFEGKIYCKGDLEVYFSGENTITAPDTAAIIRPIDGNSKLYLTNADDQSSLVLTNNLTIWQTIIHSFTSIELADGLYQETRTAVAYGSTPNSGYYYNLGYYDAISEEPLNYLKLTTTSNYPLWVGGVQVTSDNAANITGGQITLSNEEGKVSFDEENNILTLDEVIINMSYVRQYPIESSLANLTIKLEGEHNTFTVNEDKPYAVKGTGTGTLTFTTNENPKRCLLTVDGINATANLASGYTVSNNFETRTANIIGSDEEANDGWKVKIYNNDQTYGNRVDIWNFKNYNLSIGGSRVNSDNLAGGHSGITAYNPETHTLPLNNMDYAVKSGLEELIIEVSGEVTINAAYYSEPAISFDGTMGGLSSGTLKFVKAADADLASITLTSSDPHKAIEGFSADNITITAPLQLTSPTSVAEALTATTVTIANYNTAYDISVAGTTVTDKNKDDVLGDGKVIYDAENHKLTLNNATIIPTTEDCGIAYTGTADLTISLKGTNNVVKGNGGCSAIGYYGNEAPDLTFTKGDTNPCSLLLEAVGAKTASASTTIDGFGTVSHTGLYKIEETIPGDVNNTYKTTITSLGGGSGTAADPIIIKTTDDLMNFSKLVNNGTINTAAMYFRLAPEGGTLDCSGLSESEYKPIGSGSQPFKGTFSGNGCTISNLTAYQGGLFGNISGATIEDLNLSNCTIAGNDYCIAGLATDASNGSKIDLCTITNSTIECLSAQDNPTMGGIVARLSGSETTISNCVVNNTLIKAETTYGDQGIAGGIVGEVTSGKIENCHIKGESKITDYNNAGATLYAGAIVGKYDGEYTTLSGNDYYYDVTVETRKGTDAANKVTKDGYTQRALGNGDDVTENNGAVMYTKKVTFPTVTGVTITKDGDYYSYDATGINVAPGQTAKMIVEPSAAVKSFAASNVDATAITSEALEGNKTRYSFKMPDDAVMVTLTMKENPNLRFTYTWTRLQYGNTFSQEVKSDMPTAPAVTWSSSNEAVATVDADGVVTPVAAYNSDIEITATFAGDDTYAPATASYTVRVDKAEQYLRIKYKGTNIPLATVKVAKGNSIDIKTEYDFSCPEELVGSLVWYSNNENVVTVTNGVITTVGCGSTWIKVSSDGNSNYESDYSTFNIDVAPPTPTINLAEGTYLSTHAPITITKENIANTAISYTWDDLTDNTITPTWKDYTDAGVTIQEGTLSARVGYYDAENYNTIYSDTVSVAYTVIIDPELKYMQGTTAVTTAEWTLGKDGNTLPTLQNTHSVAVTYASSNTDVATVATDGTVTVVGIGTTTITATSAATDVYAAGEASYTLTVKRQLTVSFSASNEWATYYGTENLSTPEGLKAYQVTAVEGATVTISEIGYIPANTAVLLQNVSNNNVWTNIAASAYTGATSTFENNKLIGTASDVDVSTISGGTVYVLYNNMFKRATGGTIPANRGYLVVEPSAVNAGNAPQLSITIGDENTTAISNTDFTDNTDKANEWYSIDGVKLNGQPQKPGLYIKNGKKVFINKK